MAHTLPPFPSFNVQATDANNIGLEWAKWVDRFENFLVAYNITSDVRKKALLLHYAGEEVHDLYRSLPDDSSSATVSSTAQGAARTSTSEYDAARAKLDAHFAPRINPTFAIYRFRQAQQNVGESLDAFYARLRQLSRHCNFPDVDLEIKNQIIIATTSTRLRKYAILHSLDLPDILKQGRMFEDVEHDVSEIERSADKPVLAVRKDEQHRGSKPKRSLKPPQRPNYQAQQHHSLSTDCHNCGGKWPHGGGRSNCPAWGKTCKACNKIGHFAKYAFDVQHTAGSSNPSDYLSRHPVPQQETGTRIAKVPDEYVNFIQRQCIPKAFSVEEVVEQTKADQQLQLLPQPQEQWTQKD
ncbi:uncharacterized protein ISCGN_020587 [Ixodes scapularis]